MIAVDAFDFVSIGFGATFPFILSALLSSVPSPIKLQKCLQCHVAFDH
jgi:hypothetical protein